MVDEESQHQLPHVVLFVPERLRFAFKSSELIITAHWTPTIFLLQKRQKSDSLTFPFFLPSDLPLIGTLLHCLPNVGLICNAFCPTLLLGQTSRHCDSLVPDSFLLCHCFGTPFHTFSVMSSVFFLWVPKYPCAAQNTVSNHPLADFLCSRTPLLRSSLSTAL